MGLFLICKGMWPEGGSSDMIRLERSYWFSTPQKVFVGFCFLLELKNYLIWYKVYYLHTRYVEKHWSDHWCMIWVEKSSPENCAIMVTLVLSHVHQKNICSCIMNREFNSICISPLWFQLWWTWHTTIVTTILKFAEDGFSTLVMHQ